MKKQPKFNSESDLAEAYAALEAEFTKRCQRIKELEAALQSKSESAEPITKQTEIAGVTENVEFGGVELACENSEEKPQCELGESAAARQSHAEPISTVEETVDTVEQNKANGGDNEQSSPPAATDDNFFKPSVIKEYIAAAVREALCETAQPKTQEPIESVQTNELDEDAAFAAIIASDKVKRAVIAEYLSSLKGRSGYETVKGRVVLTPPSRPTTLEEAKRIIDRLM